MSYPKGIINNIITDLKAQNCSEIYADIMGFTTPYMIGPKDSDVEYQPDVIGVKKDSVDLFSIETNISKRVSKKDLEKWKYFLMYAKANKGNLFLVGNAYNIGVIKQSLDPIPSSLKFIHLV